MCVVYTDICVWCTQVRLATAAVVEIDNALARERLAATMGAVRPAVSGGNEVVLAKARHPVLVLRRI